MNIAKVASIDGELNDNFHWVDRDSLLELFTFEFHPQKPKISVYVTVRGNWIIDTGFLLCYKTLGGMLNKLNNLLQSGVQIGQILKFSSDQLAKGDSEITIEKKVYYEDIVNEILKGEL